MPATKHQHHFEDLSPGDFERLVYWLVKRSGDFNEVQWYGGARDKGRDVVAYKHTATRREKWYIQCKRYEKITFATLGDELDKLAEHSQANATFAPDVIVFATACAVPPQAKDQATSYAYELQLPEPYYWGRLELDEQLKAQPDTEREFFSQVTTTTLDPSQWDTYLKRYLEAVQTLYGTIHIFGQPEPVPLEGIFTHINILDRPSAFIRYDIEALREATQEDPSRFYKVEQQLAQSTTERIDGWELVRQPDNNRLFILGKPGAGKTTFLKYLTLLDCCVLTSSG